MKFRAIFLILLLTSCVTNLKKQQKDIIQTTETTPNTYELPKDVLSKIRDDYSNSSDQEFIINSLIQLGEEWEFQSARVPRCILFLSNGNFDEFKTNLENANTDWRDVIYWAEYDDNGERIYDFTKTFEENRL